MRTFLIIFGLLFIGAGVAAGIGAMVDSENGNLDEHITAGKSACSTNDPMAGVRPVTECDYTFKVPYKGEKSWLGLTLVLAGVGTEVAAAAVGSKQRPQPVPMPPVQPPAQPYGPQQGGQFHTV